MSQIKVHYIDHMGTDKTAVSAARVSFGEDNKKDLDDKDKKLIKYLAEHEHMSPFEHLVLTVKIEVPLYIRSQIHRHRTFSYNEISRRYTNKDLEFFIPETYRTQHDSNRQASSDAIDPELNKCLVEEVEIHQEQSLDLYNHLLEV